MKYGFEIHVFEENKDKLTKLNNFFFSLKNSNFNLLIIFRNIEEVIEHIPIFCDTNKDNPIFKLFVEVIKF